MQKIKKVLSLNFPQNLEKSHFRCIKSSFALKTSKQDFPKTVNEVNFFCNSMQKIWEVPSTHRFFIKLEKPYFGSILDTS